MKEKLFVVMIRKFRDHVIKETKIKTSEQKGDKLKKKIIRKENCRNSFL